MHAPPPPPHSNAYAGTVSVFGPVNVEFFGTLKSTWKSYSFSVVLEFPSSMKWLGAPLGGCVGPSTSEGRYPKSVLLGVKQIMVADLPANIAFRSTAQGSPCPDPKLLTAR